MVDPQQARLNLQRMFSEENKTSKDPSVRLKEQGNLFFKQQKYEDALACFNEAIVSIYFLT